MRIVFAVVVGVGAIGVDVVSRDVGMTFIETSKL